MRQFVDFELTTEFRERFQEALSQRDKQYILSALEPIAPADITTLLYEFNSEEFKYVIDLLDVNIRAEIIRDLDTDTRKNFLKLFSVDSLVEFMNVVDSDDAADMLNELPIKTSEEVIAGLEPVLKSQVIDLLRYDSNVAGGLMAKELIKARDNWTVVQCVEEIRKQLGHSSLSVTSIYLNHLSANDLPDKMRTIGRVFGAQKSQREELGVLLARLDERDVEQMVALLKRAAG